MNKETINVFKLISSPMAISPDDGKKLFKEIVNLIESKKVNEIVIDFSKIEILLTVFLNNAIGQIYGTKHKDFLEKNIKFTNMLPQDQETLEIVKRRAEKFFASKKN